MPAQKYLVFIRNAPGGAQLPSPAQMQDMMAAFPAWREKYGANIVDMGGRLKSTGKVLRSSGVTDGPFAEAKEVVGGYMVIAARDYDEAMQIAGECPGVVKPGSSVEVREIAAAPG